MQHACLKQCEDSCILQIVFACLKRDQLVHLETLICDPVLPPDCSRITDSCGALIGTSKTDVDAILSFRLLDQSLIATSMIG